MRGKNKNINVLTSKRQTLPKFDLPIKEKKEVSLTTQEKIEIMHAQRLEAEKEYQKLAIKRIREICVEQVPYFSSIVLNYREYHHSLDSLRIFKDGQEEYVNTSTGQLYKLRENTEITYLLGELDDMQSNAGGGCKISV